MHVTKGSRFMIIRQAESFQGEISKQTMDNSIKFLMKHSRWYQMTTDSNLRAPS
jgi:hypothetical protein